MITQAKLISEKALGKRVYWIEEIRKLSGHFGNDTARLEKELVEEISKYGVNTLKDHLRLCGDIPESYGHDSSEEKLYSKYTDTLLAIFFNTIGFKSLVLKERADAADVEVFAETYSFVADAKAFRLSRTAKNQKDFKIQAMDNWKRGKDNALVVCPIYQLPVRSSQIYEQATARNVCILSYSHLSVILGVFDKEGKDAAQKLLRSLFDVVPTLNASKDAINYWTALNKILISHSSISRILWAEEKVASVESIAAAKEVAIRFLLSEKERIMRMTHHEALHELIKINKIETRIGIIESVNDSGVMNVAG